jgi:hypothetical protein
MTDAGSQGKASQAKTSAEEQERSADPAPMTDAGSQGKASQAKTSAEEQESNISVQTVVFPDAICHVLPDSDLLNRVRSAAAEAKADAGSKDGEELRSLREKKRYVESDGKKELTLKAYSVIETALMRDEDPRRYLK